MAGCEKLFFVTQASEFTNKDIRSIESDFALTYGNVAGLRAECQVIITALNVMTGSRGVKYWMVITRFDVIGSTSDQSTAEPQSIKDGLPPTSWQSRSSSSSATFTSSQAHTNNTARTKAAFIINELT